MFVKTVTIVGKEDTKKVSKSGYSYFRYFATAPIAEGYGVGDSTYTFTSTQDFLCGDSVNIAYTLKKLQDGQTFSSWEVLSV